MATMRAPAFCHAMTANTTMTTSGRFVSASRKLRRSCRRRLVTAAKLPNKGYFAEADPRAEIYSRAPKKFDPAKKRSRWEPEFIWQTNWQEALKYEQDLRAQAEKKTQEDASKTEGKLSLSRVAALETLNTDLTDQLATKSPYATTSSSAPAAAPKEYLSMDIFAAKGSASRPTRTEEKRYAKKWRRGDKFTGMGANASSPTLDEVDEKAIEEERAQYAKLKAELQALTMALTGFSFAVSYAFYTKDIAASYAMGALAGLIYLRQLNQSADVMGGSGVEAAAGVLSQPRLLVPAALVLVFSRWNAVLAEPTDVHLQLIPMLLGFFTYKAAMVGKQAWTIMMDISQDVQGPYESMESKGVGLSRRGVGREGASPAE